MQVQTTLLEGSVRVKANNDKVILQPGQQAEFLLNGKNNIQVKKDIDITEVMAWQKGLFKFRNADRGKIARQLSRWYNIEVETEGKLTTLKLGGGISKKIPLSQSA